MLGKEPRHKTFGTPLKKARPSFGGFLSPSPFGTPAQTPKGTPRSRTSSEDRKRSFDEWLKIAADNKINVQNTWNLALIDYFADMTLLREGDSINFQKASFTLDGCVKVYTSRIDSVDSEARKLLIGLAGSEEEKEVVEGEEKVVKRRKQTAKTLDDNSALSMKEFELDFIVDPLFQKTASDFDEGGAKGLLLSHLDISPNGNLIFDASDSTDLFVGEDVDLDLSDLKGTLELIAAEFSPKLANVSLEICPTFSNFQFNTTSEDFTVPLNREDFYADNLETISNFGEEDHEIKANITHDDQDYGGFDGNDMSFNDNDASNVFDAANTTITPQETEKIIQMVENSIPIDESGFAYFEQKGRNWAGPEFWKSRSTKKFSENTTKTVSKRKPKTTLEFNEDEKVDPEVLFAKGKTSTLLAKSSKSSDDHLLPEDLKYSWDKMTTLFLKPFKLQEIKQLNRQVVARDSQMEVGREASGNFQLPDDMGVDFAPQQNDVMDDDIGGDFFGGFDDEDDNDDPLNELPSQMTIPAHIANGAELEYGDQLVSEPVRTKSKPIFFARQAKRVDVQKLKENLWEKINEETETKTFTHIVSELDQVYQPKQRKDISVAFCFICVLHLANENNLTIQGDANMKELIIS
ncbi:hypothetical protein HK103_003360 [Boothiomyces macroporosus]|uniref:Condensin complex subunit 2 n=1 Tax=Boothiomyces macroporosus TaxID=261099 RepID=A0AAD5UMK0_9FUNG|nr:hypothetical protein HK103_003360 [Boothiomyces macroporosus]